MRDSCGLCVVDRAAVGSYSPSSRRISDSAVDVGVVLGLAEVVVDWGVA